MPQKGTPHMEPTIQHFLLVFDHGDDRLLREESFGPDLAAATEAYAAAEAEHRDNGLVDIVLVGSDSIETVRVTHSTYFDGRGRSMINDLLERALR